MLPAILPKSTEEERYLGIFRTSLSPQIAFLLVLGLRVSNRVAYGQVTACIVGTVTDTSGAAFGNARIKLSNAETGLVRTHG